MGFEIPTQVNPDGWFEASGQLLPGTISYRIVFERCSGPISGEIMLSELTIRRRKERLLMKKRMASFMVVDMLMRSLARSSEPRPASTRNSSETRRVNVYQDASPEVSLRWIPEGYMPGGTGIALKTDAEERPFEGKACVLVRFNLEGSGWRGVYWLAAGWKPVRRGPNLFELLGMDASDKNMGVRLVIHARSSQRAGVQFKVGGIREGEYVDSLSWPVESEWIQ